MTDPFILDDEPFVLVVPSGAAIPPSNITEAEWLALKDRVTVVEAGQDLGDLNDVDTAGVADGQTIIYDADTGLFVPGSSGGTIARVSNAGTSDNAYDVEYISLRYGLRFLPTSPGVIFLEPVYGTQQRTIAEGNHTHQRPSIYRPPILPGGYMSGGTRSLASQNVTLPAGKECTVTARVDMQVRGADPGPAYYRLSITVDGNTRTSPAGTDGFWGVQGVPSHPSFSHVRNITGAGSAINVSASIAYYDGSGFYTDAGDLEIRVEYDR